MLYKMIDWCRCILCCSRPEPILQHGKLDQLDESYKEMQTYGQEFTIVSD